MRVQMMRCGWWLALLFGGAAQGATLNVTAEYNPATYEAGGAKLSTPPPAPSFRTRPVSGAAPRPQWRRPRPFGSMPISSEK